MCEGNYSFFQHNYLIYNNHHQSSQSCPMKGKIKRSIKAVKNSVVGRDSDSDSSHSDRSTSTSDEQESKVRKSKLRKSKLGNPSSYNKGNDVADLDNSTVEKTTKKTTFRNHHVLHSVSLLFVFLFGTTLLFCKIQIDIVPRFGHYVCMDSNTGQAAYMIPLHIFLIWNTFTVIVVYFLCSGYRYREQSSISDKTDTVYVETADKSTKSTFWTHLNASVEQLKPWQSEFFQDTNKYILQRINELPGSGNESSLFHCVGIDVFQKTSPESKIYSHPQLQKAGIRSKPLFIVNFMTSSSNIVLYFEMPHWVNKFNEISIKDSDSSSVKAFKKFLLGNDEYKMERFRIFLSLKEGPYALTMLVPTKKKLTLSHTSMSMTWYQEDEKKLPDGKMKHAIMEVDCVFPFESSEGNGNKLFKRVMKQAHQMVVDSAILIHKKVYENAESSDDDDDSDDNVDLPSNNEIEPWACLARFRLHKLDLKDGAMLSMIS